MVSVRHARSLYKGSQQLEIDHENMRMKRCRTALRTIGGDQKDGQSIIKEDLKDLKLSKTCPVIPLVPTGPEEKDKMKTQV